MENYPKWLNNLIYFLAGIGFYGVLLHFLQAMADITMCSGQDCPVKEECYRFTALKCAYRQSYFAETPGKTEDGKFTCEMYWDDNKELPNGKDNS